jgi:hypothetical protein
MVDRGIPIVLQSLTVSVERNTANPPLTLRNSRVCPGAAVWIADCITIDFPESLTGWRDTRSCDANCYQPAT